MVVGAYLGLLRYHERSLIKTPQAAFEDGDISMKVKAVKALGQNADLARRLSAHQANPAIQACLLERGSAG